MEEMKKAQKNDMQAKEEENSVLNAQIKELKNIQESIITDNRNREQQIYN